MGAAAGTGVRALNPTTGSRTPASVIGTHHHLRGMGRVYASAAGLGLGFRGQRRPVERRAAPAPPAGTPAG